MVINKILKALIVATALLSAGTTRCDAQQVPPGFNLVGQMRPTFYWIALETETAEERGTPVYGTRGEELTRVAYSYFRNLLLEGTGKLLDGRVLNYSGAVGAQHRFRECGPEAPFGYGAGGRTLMPFRSVAVDPRVIPLDSEVYLPAAVGARLPDGTVHDGIFRAVDVGGAIQNLKIDVFTGAGDQSSVFAPNLLSLRNTPVYIRPRRHQN